MTPRLLILLAACLLLAALLTSGGLDHGARTAASNAAGSAGVSRLRLAAEGTVPPPTVPPTSATHVPSQRASRSRPAVRVPSPSRAPQVTQAPAVHAGSVDGMPALLRRIGGCESSGHPDGPLVWNAVNRSGSSASGAFQVIDGTWRSWRKAYGASVGAEQYARAKDAPPSVQVHVATGAFNAQGSGPWKASRRCWA